MKVSVDADLCDGCALCVESCPEVFDMGDDDLAHVKMTRVPPDLEDAVREASDECPTDAIPIEE